MEIFLKTPALECIFRDAWSLDIFTALELMGFLNFVNMIFKLVRINLYFFVIVDSCAYPNCDMYSLHTELDCKISD